MNINLLGYFDLKKSISIVNRITRRDRGPEPAQWADPLSAEIRRIEKVLAGNLQRSASNRVRSKAMEPLAEYQKTMDLAG